MPNKFVYMDYNATTPLHPLVKQALVDNLDLFANASSMHEQGRQARSTIEAARLYVAQLIGAQRNPEQLVFTSGGSESNNTVFATMFHLGRKQDRNQIITTAIEHPCVLNAAKWLESEGFPVHFLGVDGDGRIDEREWEAARNDMEQEALRDALAELHEVAEVDSRALALRRQPSAVTTSTPSTSAATGRRRSTRVRAATRTAWPLRSAPEEAAVGGVLGIFSVEVGMGRINDTGMPRAWEQTCSIFVWSPCPISV